MLTAEEQRKVCQIGVLVAHSSPRPKYPNSSIPGSTGASLGRALREGTLLIHRASAHG